MPACLCHKRNPCPGAAERSRQAEARECPRCFLHLRRKPGEKNYNFWKRRFCGKRCAALYRESQRGNHA